MTAAPGQRVARRRARARRRGGRVDARGRRVDQQHVGVGEQRAGEREPHPHPGRPRRRPGRSPARASPTWCSTARARSVAAPAVMPCSRPAKTRFSRPEMTVVRRRPRRRSRARSGRAARGSPPAQPSSGASPAVGGARPGEHAQQRGLAGARRAEQPVDLARADGRDRRRAARCAGRSSARAHGPRSTGPAGPPHAAMICRSGCGALNGGPGTLVSPVRTSPSSCAERRPRPGRSPRSTPRRSPATPRRSSRCRASPATSGRCWSASPSWPTPPA